MVTVPGSQALADSLGLGAAFSGWLVGSGFLLTAVGALVGKRILRPDSGSRLAVLISCAIPIVANTLYAMAADSAWSQSWGAQCRVALLLVARAALGLQGLQSVVMKVVATKATPLREMVGFNFSMSACSTVGIAFGPLANSLICYALGLKGLGQMNSIPSVVYAIFWLCLLGMCF